MKYTHLIKTNKFVSKFAYIFLALFAFMAFACESNNDDNPLRSSTVEGYISDTNYWFADAPKIRSFGKDSLGKDSVLTLEATSIVDGSTISMLVAFPDVSSFSVEAAADSTDSTNRPRTTIKYNGTAVPTGTINITRFDTVRYILEAEFNFSFEGTVQGDSGTVDTTSVGFTRGKIKAAYLRRKY